MATAKEHFLRYYHNEPMERFPSWMTDTNSVMTASLCPTGMDERPGGSGKDWYGCDWVFDPANGAPVLDLTKPPVLSDITTWREVIKMPDLDKIDWAASAKADDVENFDPDKANYFSLPQGPFERLHTLMGFEEAMYAMIEEPEEVTALFDKIMEVKLKCIEVLAKYYKADVISFHDDWGTQNDLFFSPQMWRELIKPQIQKAIDYCHSLGVVFELHCCGKIDKIIPEIAEMGVDSLQCMGINDIAAMKKITGTKMGYTVSPRYQQWAVLAQQGKLTEELLREQLRAEIREEAEGGRYYSFFFPWPEWWANVILDEIAKYGEEICKEMRE